MWLSQHKCWYYITHLFINTILNQIFTHVKFEQKYVFSYEHTTKNFHASCQFYLLVRTCQQVVTNLTLHQVATNLLKSDTIDISIYKIGYNQLY